MRYSLVAVFLVGCAAAATNIVTTEPVTLGPAQTEGVDELPSQEGVCEGAIPPGEYVFHHETKINIASGEGDSLFGDLFGMARLPYVGTVSEVGTEEERAITAGEGFVVQVVGANGPQRAVLRLGRPSLCLLREVTMEDGDLEIRMGVGTPVAIKAWTRDRARVTHDLFGRYSVVVPTSWLSLEGCSTDQEGTQSQGIRVARSINPSTCLLPAPGFYGGSRRGQLVPPRMPLEVLEERDGWSRVRAQRGRVVMRGWIRQRPSADPESPRIGISLVRSLPLGGGFEAPVGTPGFVQSGHATLRLPFAGGELWPYLRVPDDAYEETGAEVEVRPLFSLTPNIAFECDEGPEETSPELQAPPTLNAVACPAP